jgi:hypothetical protein
MLVITIPGLLLEPLREGAYVVSRDVAEAIDHMQDLRSCRARLDGVCRLLDVIGWNRQHAAVDTEVDFGVHSGTLRAVAEVMLPVLSDAGERELHEALREFVAMELPGARQRLEFPVEIVVLLRGVLLVEVSRAAGALSDACSQAPTGDWAGPLRWLDGVRALLDEIGWSAPEHEQPIELDLKMYGPLVQDVMENDLEIQRDLQATADASQRERASATRALVERVLTSLKEAS